MFRTFRLLCSFTLLPLPLLLFGCSTQSSAPHFVIPAGKQAILVHGGPQPPVSGSSIQLYAVGTTGDGSAATPLLSPPATTDANGAFNITGTYTCPSPSTLVYLVGTGGDPGLTPPANNAAISMMAALGPCGNLTPSTYIFVDEPTTVAAVYALAPFLSSPSAIGSAPEDATALADAFTLADELANTTTGTSPGIGVPPGVTVPVAQINTIADILSTCINSAGGVSGDGSACGTLFSLTTPPGLTPATDTITALLHLADDPTLNTTALYSLATDTAPFQPIQSQVPPDLSVHLTVSSGFTISPSTLNFPATRIASTSTSQTLTFTNSTAVPVAIDIATLGFSGANPNDFSTANAPYGQTCWTPILPGASCILNIVFKPTAVGTRSAYLTVANTSVNPSISILVTGVGLEAGAGPAYLTPTSLNFTAAGTPSNLTLTNSGTLPLTIDGFNISSDPTSGQPAFTQTNNCGASLAPQATCTIAVTALSTTQAYSTGILSVADDSGYGPQSSSLSYSNGFTGTVVFDFGSRSIGTQGTAPLSFEPPGYPSGTDTLTLTGPNASDFSFVSTSSSQSGSCFVSRSNPSCGTIIYFNPSALGLRTATLNVNGTPYGGVIGVGLAAGLHFTAGFAGGVVVGGVPYSIFTPLSSINFSTLVIGQTSPINPVTVLNTGTAPLTLNTPVLTGPAAADFNVTSTCTTLAPNATCTLSITATPTQSAYRFATLTLSDSTATAQQTIALSVLGANPPPVATPNSLAFPYTPLGTTSASQSFTVTSFNNDPVTVQVLNSATSPFVITQGSSCSVTPCQVSVVFSPTTANTAPPDGNNAYEQILITDLFAGQATQVQLSGIFQPPPPPTTTATILPGLVTFDPQTVGTTSSTTAITITNTGSQPLINQIVFNGTNPGDFIFTNPCPTTIAVGDQCTLTVAFAPTATGLRSANVVITANTSNYSSPISISVTGTGQ